jgi:hypothetical protein
LMCLIALAAGLGFAFAVPRKSAAPGELSALPQTGRGEPERAVA